MIIEVLLREKIDKKNNQFWKIISSKLKKIMKVPEVIDVFWSSACYFCYFCATQQCIFIFLQMLYFILSWVLKHILFKHLIKMISKHMELSPLKNLAIQLVYVATIEKIELWKHAWGSKLACALTQDHWWNLQPNLFLALKMAMKEVQSHVFAIKKSHLVNTLTEIKLIQIMLMITCCYSCAVRK